MPYPEKEVDLVALHGRDLVLAECKESTEHLAEAEKAARFARQTAEMVVLADYLGASQLLICRQCTQWRKQLYCERHPLTIPSK